MKKIISITSLLLLLVSANFYAQSNLTWVAKDKIEDNTFKTRLEFHISVIGFANEGEATKFVDKMKTNQEVEYCKNLGKDEKGAYSIVFKMKKVAEANYYIGWAQKLGVEYIEAKGQKKTPMEWIAESRK